MKRIVLLLLMVLPVFSVCEAQQGKFRQNAKAWGEYAKNNPDEVADLFESIGKSIDEISDMIKRPRYPNEIGRGMLYFSEEDYENALNQFTKPMKDKGEMDWARVMTHYYAAYCYANLGYCRKSFICLGFVDSFKPDWNTVMCDTINYFKDKAKTFRKLLLKSIISYAEEGDVYAQHELIDYYRGSYYGAVTDAKQLFYWSQKAAKQNNAVGMYSLAICYWEGYGTQVDNNQAFYWMNKAANKNNADAQYVLSGFYGMGIGVKADYVEALTWLEKSSENGCEDAKRQLERMRIYQINDFNGLMSELKKIKSDAQTSATPKNIDNFYLRFVHSVTQYKKLESSLTSSQKEQYKSLYNETANLLKSKTK